MFYRLIKLLGGKVKFKSSCKLVEAFISHKPMTVPIKKALRKFLTNG